MSRYGRSFAKGLMSLMSRGSYVSYVESNYINSTGPKGLKRFAKMSASHHSICFAVTLSSRLGQPCQWPTRPQRCQEWTTFRGRTAHDTGSVYAGVLILDPYDALTPKRQILPNWETTSSISSLRERNSPHPF